ncbi:hypothetical protein VTJ49DRAFT_426 [Mycothermus thermophilus]|uniref:Involucrin repeat protein n=1 Tax=Humicola insolens TaxID=85995 RepID=A0ABR3VGU0_HUMIN
MPEDLPALPESRPESPSQAEASPAETVERAMVSPPIAESVATQVLEEQEPVVREELPPLPESRPGSPDVSGEVLAGVAVAQPEVADAQPDIAAQPEAVEAESEAAEPQPAAVEAQSETLEPKPEAVQDQPEAVDAKPEVVEEQPKVVEAQPEVVEDTPEVVVVAAALEVAEPEPPVVEARSGVAEPQPVEPQPEAVEAQIESAEPEPPVVEAQSEVAEAKSEPVEPRHPEPEAEPAVVEAQSEVAEAKSEPVEPRHPEPEAEPAVVEAQSEAADAKSEPAEPQPEAVEVQTEPTKPEPAVVEAQPEVVEAQPELAEPRSEVVESQPAVPVQDGQVEDNPASDQEPPRPESRPESPKRVLEQQQDVSPEETQVENAATASFEPSRLSQQSTIHERDFAKEVIHERRLSQPEEPPASHEELHRDDFHKENPNYPTTTRALEKEAELEAEEKRIQSIPLPRAAAASAAAAAEGIVVAHVRHTDDSIPSVRLQRLDGDKLKDDGKLQLDSNLADDNEQAESVSSFNEDASTVAASEAPTYLSGSTFYESQHDPSGPRDDSPPRPGTLGFLLGGRRGGQYKPSQIDYWRPGSPLLLRRDKGKTVEVQPVSEPPVQGLAEQATDTRAASTEEAPVISDKKKGKGKAGRKEVSWIEPKAAVEQAGSGSVGDAPGPSRESHPTSSPEAAGSDKQQQQQKQAGDEREADVTPAPETPKLWRKRNLWGSPLSALPSIAGGVGSLFGIAGKGAASPPSAVREKSDKKREVNDQPASTEGLDNTARTHDDSPQEQPPTTDVPVAADEGGESAGGMTKTDKQQQSEETQQEISKDEPVTQEETPSPVPPFVDEAGHQVATVSTAAVDPTIPEDSVAAGPPADAEPAAKKGKKAKRKKKKAVDGGADEAAAAAAATQPEEALPEPSSAPVEQPQAEQTASPAAVVEEGTVGAADAAEATDPVAQEDAAPSGKKSKKKKKKKAKAGPAVAEEVSGEQNVPEPSLQDSARPTTSPALAPATEVPADVPETPAPEAEPAEPTELQPDAPGKKELDDTISPDADDTFPSSPSRKQKKRHNVTFAEPLEEHLGFASARGEENNTSDAIISSKQKAEDSEDPISEVPAVLSPNPGGAEGESVHEEPAAAQPQEIEGDTRDPSSTHEITEPAVSLSQDLSRETAQPDEGGEPREAAGEDTPPEGPSSPSESRSLGAQSDAPVLHAAASDATTAPQPAAHSTTGSVTTGAAAAEDEPITSAPAAGDQSQGPHAHQEPSLEALTPPLPSVEDQDKKKAEDEAHHESPELEVHTEEALEPTTSTVAAVDDVAHPLSAQPDIAARSSTSETPSQSHPDLTADRDLGATDSHSDVSSSAPRDPASSSDPEHLQPSDSGPSGDMPSAEEERSPYSLLNKTKKTRKKPKTIDTEPWPLEFPEQRQLPDASPLEDRPILSPRTLQLLTREDDDDPYPSLSRRAERMIKQLSTVEEETEPPSDYPESDGRSLLSADDLKSQQQQQQQQQSHAQDPEPLDDDDQRTELADSEGRPSSSLSQPLSPTRGAAAFPTVGLGAAASRIGLGTVASAIAAAYSLKKATGKKKDKKLRRTVSSVSDEPWPRNEADGVEELAETRIDDVLEEGKDRAVAGERNGEPQSAPEPGPGGDGFVKEAVSQGPPVEKADNGAVDALAGPPTSEDVPAPRDGTLSGDVQSLPEEPAAEPAHEESAAQKAKSSNEQVIEPSSDETAVELTQEAQTIPEVVAQVQDSVAEVQQPTADAAPAMKLKKSKKRAKKAAKEEQAEAEPQPSASETPAPVLGEAPPQEGPEQSVAAMEAPVAEEPVTHVVAKGQEPSPDPHETQQLQRTVSDMVQEAPAPEAETVVEPVVQDTPEQLVRETPAPQPDLIIEPAVQGTMEETVQPVPEDPVVIEPAGKEGKKRRKSKGSKADVTSAPETITMAEPTPVEQPTQTEEPSSIDELAPIEELAPPAEPASAVEPTSDATVPERSAPRPTEEPVVTEEAVATESAQELLTAIPGQTFPPQPLEAEQRYREIQPEAEIAPLETSTPTEAVPETTQEPDMGFVAVQEPEPAPVPGSLPGRDKTAGEETTAQPVDDIPKREEPSSAVQASAPVVEALSPAAEDTLPVEEPATPAVVTEEQPAATSDFEVTPVVEAAPPVAEPVPETTAEEMQGRPTPKFEVESVLPEAASSLSEEQPTTLAEAETVPAAPVTEEPSSSGLREQSGEPVPDVPSQPVPDVPSAPVPDVPSKPVPETTATESVIAQEPSAPVEEPVPAPVEESSIPVQEEKEIVPEETTRTAPEETSQPMTPVVAPAEPELADPPKKKKAGKIAALMSLFESQSAAGPVSSRESGLTTDVVKEEVGPVAEQPAAAPEVTPVEEPAPAVEPSPPAKELDSTTDEPVPAEEPAVDTIATPQETTDPATVQDVPAALEIIPETQPEQATGPSAKKKKKKKKGKKADSAEEPGTWTDVSAPAEVITQEPVIAAEEPIPTEEPVPAPEEIVSVPEEVVSAPEAAALDAEQTVQKSRPEVPPPTEEPPAERPSAEQPLVEPSSETTSEVPSQAPEPLLDTPVDDDAGRSVKKKKGKKGKKASMSEPTPDIPTSVAEEAPSAEPVPQTTTPENEIPPAEAAAQINPDVTEESPLAEPEEPVLDEALTAEPQQAEDVAVKSTKAVQEPSPAEPQPDENADQPAKESKKSKKIKGSVAIDSEPTSSTMTRAEEPELTEPHRTAPTVEEPLAEQEPVQTVQETSADTSQGTEQRSAEPELLPTATKTTTDEEEPAPAVADFLEQKEPDAPLDRDLLQTAAVSAVDAQEPVPSDPAPANVVEPTIVDRATGPAVEAVDPSLQQFAAFEPVPEASSAQERQEKQATPPEATTETGAATEAKQEMKGKKKKGLLASLLSVFEPEETEAAPTGEASREVASEVAPEAEKQPDGSTSQEVGQQEPNVDPAEAQPKEADLEAEKVVMVEQQPEETQEAPVPEKGKKKKGKKSKTAELETAPVPASSPDNASADPEPTPAPATEPQDTMAEVEPVAETIVEPVAETTTEPVVEPVTETVVEHAPDLGASVPEQVPEPITAGPEVRAVSASEDQPIEPSPEQAQTDFVPAPLEVHADTADLAPVEQPTKKSKKAKKKKGKGKAAALEAEADAEAEPAPAPMPAPEPSTGSTEVPVTMMKEVLVPVESAPEVPTATEAAVEPHVELSTVPFVETCAEPLVKAPADSAVDVILESAKPAATEPVVEADVAAPESVPQPITEPTASDAAEEHAEPPIQPTTVEPATAAVAERSPDAQDNSRALPTPSQDTHDTPAALETTPSPIKDEPVTTDAGPSTEAEPVEPAEPAAKPKKGKKKKSKQAAVEAMGDAVEADCLITVPTPEVQEQVQVDEAAPPISEALPESVPRSAPEPVPALKDRTVAEESTVEPEESAVREIPEETKLPDRETAKAEDVVTPEEPAAPEAAEIKMADPEPSQAEEPVAREAEMEKAPEPPITDHLSSVEAITATTSEAPKEEEVAQTTDETAPPTWDVPGPDSEAVSTETVTAEVLAAAAAAGAAVLVNDRPSPAAGVAEKEVPERATSPAVASAEVQEVPARPQDNPQPPALAEAPAPSSPFLVPEETNDSKVETAPSKLPSRAVTPPPAAAVEDVQQAVIENVQPTSLEAQPADPEVETSRQPPDLASGPLQEPEPELPPARPTPSPAPAPRLVRRTTSSVGFGLIHNPPDPYPEDAPSPKLLSPMETQESLFGRIEETTRQPGNEEVTSTSKEASFSEETIFGSSKVAHEAPFVEEDRASRKQVKTAAVETLEQELRRKESGIHELGGPGGVSLKEHEMEPDVGVEDDRVTVAETVIEGGARLVEDEKEEHDQQERKVVKMELERQDDKTDEVKTLEEERALVQQPNPHEDQGPSTSRSISGGAPLGRMDSETIPRSLREPRTAKKDTKKAEKKEKRSRSPSPEPVQRAFSFPDDIADEEMFSTRDASMDKNRDKTREAEELVADPNAPVRLPPLSVSAFSEFMRSHSSLAPVPEELSEEEEEETQTKRRRRPQHRDSGFSSGSPIMHDTHPTQPSAPKTTPTMLRTRTPTATTLEPLRDSGVHLRDSVESDRPRSLSPVHPVHRAHTPRDQTISPMPPLTSPSPPILSANRPTLRERTVFHRGTILGPESPRLVEPSPPAHTPEPEKQDLRLLHMAKKRISPPGAGLIPANTSVARLRTPDLPAPLALRPDSPGTPPFGRSGTSPPQLRRMDKRASGDLRNKGSVGPIGDGWCCGCSRSGSVGRCKAFFGVKFLLLVLTALCTKSRILLCTSTSTSTSTCAQHADACR